MRENVKMRRPGGWEMKENEDYISCLNEVEVKCYD